MTAVLLQHGPTGSGSGDGGVFHESFFGQSFDEFSLVSAASAVLVMAGRCGSGGRAGRGCRIEGALSAQMSEKSLPSAGPVESERFEEGRPEFGGHDVVEDGIDGGIEVEHDSTKVEHVVVRLGSHHLDVLVRRQDEPQREDLEGQEADEEEDDHRAQHRHHLSSVKRESTFS